MGRMCVGAPCGLKETAQFTSETNIDLTTTRTSNHNREKNGRILEKEE